MVMLAVFAAGVVLELSTMLTFQLPSARRGMALTALAATAFAAGALAAARPNFFTVLIAFLNLYHGLNLLRIIEARMHENYLRRAAWRTSAALWLLQGLTASGWLAWDKWHTTGHAAWSALAAVQVLAALALLASTLRRLRRTAWVAQKPQLADSELPTISVAIPARNETEDLEECLLSLLGSDYPKLEVLVLDDCSQNKRTPEIIRQFAHDGVRFVQGEPPLDTWLPKNQAYDKLVQECSGEYILFCGVDVRFGPASIRELVGLSLAKNKQMISVLPWRAERAGTALAQAMRYWWELAPPRRLFGRPPVLSTCWLVRKELLEKSGGFAAVARSIVPEAFFARRALAADGYSFVRASLASGIQSVKSTAEQRATAVRTRYPQLHRRPENVALAALLELTFLALPFIMAVFGVWLHIGALAIALAVVASLLLVVTYQLITLATHTGGILFGLIGLPVGVLYDIALSHYSMWRYEFYSVEWKDRNICIPAMHVIPHLPKLD